MGNTTFGITTLSIKTLTIMTPKNQGLFATLSINDPQHNNNLSTCGMSLSLVWLVMTVMAPTNALAYYKKE
jgi:hypothetical protein